MKINSLNLNLAPLIKKLEVSLKKGSQETITASFKSVFRGKGLEFDRFRVYTTQDDAKEIDWKASLRAQELMVKVLTEERNVNIVFLVDVSNSMIFTSGTQMKCEYAAELVATLSYALIEGGDKVGLIMFTDKIVKHLRSNGGMNQFYKITKYLSEPSLYGGDYDPVYAMRYITEIIKQGSIVFFVSDFIGIEGNWKTSLDIMAHKFDMVGIMVRDHRDNSLDDCEGQFVVGDPYSGDDILIDVSTIREPYNENAKQQIADIQNLFRRVGADLLVLETNEEFVHPILKLFNRRKMTWR
jgi:uncharacterized protein (DUF58 family)